KGKSLARFRSASRIASERRWQTTTAAQKRKRDLTGNAGNSFPCSYSGDPLCRSSPGSRLCTNPVRTRSVGRARGHTGPGWPGRPPGAGGSPATFVVNLTTDTGLTDGLVTPLGPGTPGDLRNAIFQADQSPDADNVIDLRGVSGTINLSAMLPPVFTTGDG